MPKPSLLKRPTWTHLVEESLRTADDFMSMKAICLATGGSPNQVSAALYSLQSYRVVDCVASPEGLHWFFRGEDSRCRSLEERTPEEKPRKMRRTTARKEQS